MIGSRDVAIAGVWNTTQARVLEGATSESVQLEAAYGVLEACGARRADVDGISGQFAENLAYRLGLGPVWVGNESLGIAGVSAAATAIAAGLCESVLVVGGHAGHSPVHPAGGAPVPVLHQVPNEFVSSVGMYTAVEFALTARTHMERFGTQPEHLATVAATIRNNGYVNPEAVHFGRGPYTAAEVLDSRMIADPFHLLDCSITSEGACALLVTTPSRARDLRLPPVYWLGAQLDFYGPSYAHAPSWDLDSFDGTSDTLGWVGARAARTCFGRAGITPDDIDCLELYDAFSFEVIRELEAFGFCAPGEGGDLVMNGGIAPDGRFPVCTDGGLLSFSHNRTGQTHQKIGRAVQQLQGRCASLQLESPRFALCSNGGAGASWCQVAIVGRDAP